MHHGRQLTEKCWLLVKEPLPSELRDYIKAMWDPLLILSLVGVQLWSHHLHNWRQLVAVVRFDVSISNGRDDDKRGTTYHVSNQNPGLPRKIGSALRGSR